MREGRFSIEYQRLLNCFEYLLRHFARRTFPSGRKFIEWCSGIDTLAWISLLRVVLVAANAALVLC